MLPYTPSPSRKIDKFLLNAGRTTSKLSKVRVNRKGQVTIPLGLRSKLGIEEGVLLEVKEEDGAIVLRPTPRLKGGKIVGEKEHAQIIRELDKLRKDWR